MILIELDSLVIVVLVPVHAVLMVESRLPNEDVRLLDHHSLDHIHFRFVRSKPFGQTFPTVSSRFNRSIGLPP